MGAPQRVAAAANGQFARQYDQAYKESGYSPDRAPKLRFGPGSNASPRKRGVKLSLREFNALMRTLANAWNSNNAKQAADCFAEGAMYSFPPNPQIRRGREALFEFFGGPKGRPRPMRMEWHHLLFDEEHKIGAANTPSRTASALTGW